MSDSAEYFGKGVEALRNGHYFLARVCFEVADETCRTPETASYLAYALAMSRGDFRAAAALASAALEQEPDNPLHYLHLGKIHLQAGERLEALSVFREGLRRTGSSQVKAEMDKLGTRKPPVFRSLDRSHPANKYIGLCLSRLALR